MLNFNARRKQRTASHIGEEASFDIIRNIFPEQWVIRAFDKPDYGIDQVFELFKKIDGQSRVYETLGEYLFVQVKSVEKPKYAIQKYHPIMNVAKSVYRQDKSVSLKTEVIKFSIDTNELVTIQAMGSSVCVLLLLIALDSKRVFFLNLNDLIDKVIIPQRPDFRKKKTIVIDVPVLNELKKSDERSFAPLEFYAKRAKLLAAFSTFLYQQNELNYSLQAFNPSFWGPRSIAAAASDPDWADIRMMLKQFIAQILELDIWDLKKFNYFQPEVNGLVWKYFSEYHDRLGKLSKKIAAGRFDIQSEKGDILLLWFWLGNLNNVYQELCREWWLPKFLALLSSYPDYDLEANSRKDLDEMMNVLHKHFR
jgi:hypothetical protein